MAPPEINTAEFAIFFLILIRVSIIVFLAPVFGSTLVPVQVKIPLCLALTFALSSTVKVNPADLPAGLLLLVPLILGEVFIGLALSLIIRMLMEGVQLAGQYIGYQMGFAIVNVVNPQTGAQSSVLAQFVYILALVIFLAVNGHYIIIKALVESFALVPIGKPALSSVVMNGVIASVTRMFVIAIKVGAPALGILFCVKVAMGIVAKTVPQLNVLFVGMPLYIIIGMIMLGLSLNLFVPIFGRELKHIENTTLEFLRAM